MDNVNDLLFAFKAHLQARGRSPATVALYLHQAGQFLRPLSGLDIKAVTKSHIEAYIAGLYGHKNPQGQALSVATIAVKVRAVKRLFAYLEGANIVFIDPAEAIQEPAKVPSTPRNVLTARQMQTLLDQPNLGLLTGIRDRAMLEVFYATGIRREELCNLSVFDADLQGGMLRVTRGKGGKGRVVPLTRPAVRFLREYIAKVRPKLTVKNRKTRQLFVNRYGGPLSSQVVSILIRTYGRQAGMGCRVTAHCLRHTFATVLVKNGADIVAVQKMLGHSDLTVTQQYIRSLGLSIKAVHQKTHPREKDRAVKENVKVHIERIKGRYERKP